MRDRIDRRAIGALSDDVVEELSNCTIGGVSCGGFVGTATYTMLATSDPVILDREDTKKSS